LSEHIGTSREIVSQHMTNSEDKGIWSIRGRASFYIATPSSGCERPRRSRPMFEPMNPHNRHRQDGKLEAVMSVGGVFGCCHPAVANPDHSASRVDWARSPMSTLKVKARFIEPMLLLKTEKLPEGADRLFEIKLDGYRAVAFKTGGKVYLRSRNNKDFNGK